MISILVSLSSIGLLAVAFTFSPFGPSVGNVANEVADCPTCTASPQNESIILATPNCPSGPGIAMACFVTEHATKPGTPTNGGCKTTDGICSDIDCQWPQIRVKVTWNNTHKNNCIVDCCSIGSVIVEGPGGSAVLQGPAGWWPWFQPTSVTLPWYSPKVACDTAAEEWILIYCGIDVVFSKRFKWRCGDCSVPPN